MTRRRAFLLSILSALVTVAAVVLVYPAGGLQLSLPKILPASTVLPGFYKVTQVYDGDTFAVDMNGTAEKIRLIGVDTPETHKPNSPVQCFGPQASEFTKQILAKAGNAVRLEADPSGDNRDRYDRLLRYAYLPDGTLLQQSLIAQGYGFAYTTFTFQKKAEFVAAQTNAQTAKSGLWASCKTTNKNSRWQTNNLP